MTTPYVNKKPFIKILDKLHTSIDNWQGVDEQCLSLLHAIANNESQRSQVMDLHKTECNTRITKEFPDLIPLLVKKQTVKIENLLSQFKSIFSQQLKPIVDQLYVLKREIDRLGAGIPISSTLIKTHPADISVLEAIEWVSDIVATYDQEYKVRKALIATFDLAKPDFLDQLVKRWEEQTCLDLTKELEVRDRWKLYKKELEE